MVIKCHDSNHIDDIRVMLKAQETKSRNTRYQSEKTSSIKRLWYNHEYFEEYNTKDIRL